MAAPPIFGVFDLWKNQRRLEGLQESIGQEPTHHRFTASHVKIETIYTSHHLLLYFSHDVGRSPSDQLLLDAEALFDTSLDFFSELGAGGNGDDNLSFLLSGFDDLVPLVLRRLTGLPLDKVAGQHCAANENDKKEQFHASPREVFIPPKASGLQRLRALLLYRSCLRIGFLIC